MMESRHLNVQEIACQQVLQKDASVFSVQWTVLPQRLAPAFLVESYLAHIRRFTRGLVRPLRSERGVEFRLLGTRFSLLRFHGPVLSGGGGSQAAALVICGGLLVQPQSRDRGELTFACETIAGGTRVTVQLADYRPLLLGGPAPSRGRKRLYRMTQAALHRLVTVRFLARLGRDLADTKVRCRVVKIQETEGEEL